MTETSARPGPIRWISVAAFVAWGCLFATTYGYAPGLHHAWGLNLLAYMPEWLAWLTTGVALLLTADETRRGLIAAGRWIGGRLSPLPTAVQIALLFTLAFGLLWLLRQRVPPGDAQIAVMVLGRAGRAAYPETGSIWLLHEIFQVAHALDLGPIRLALLAGCAAGAAAVVFVVRAARYVAPAGRAAAVVPLLALSGGIGAALVGRIDVQGMVLAAAALYFWASLRAVVERGPATRPALALGLLAWLEPFSLMLLPSLLEVLRGRRSRERAAAFGLALLPLVLHAVFLLAIQPRELPAATIVGRALGSARGWLGLPGAASGLGTDYVIASVAHLEYLANAGLALAAGAIALLPPLVPASRTRLLSDPPTRFLVVASAGLLVAALTVRPAWGPWDWDLFAVPALALALLAGGLLAQLPGERRLHIAVATAGLQLCFFGLPLVGLGFGTTRDAGPFFPKRFDSALIRVDREPPPRIAPWL